MPEAFKEKFNSSSIQHLARIIELNCNEFKTSEFIRLAETDLTNLELKARSNQIKNALACCMPVKVKRVLEVLHASLGDSAAHESISFEAQDSGISGWIIMPVADYVAELTVKQHPEHFFAGLDFMKACTSRFSAEFAIRLFLLEQPENTLSSLLQWIDDDNPHVRRLVSEGTRPYLPWGINLKLFVQEPQLILPLLDKLKDDPSEYVRRSVANNLNDISKDHPKLVSSLAAKWWQPNNQNRQQLIKHACRTLIKQGHPDTLFCFGFQPVSNNMLGVELEVTDVIKIGDSIDIQCRLKNKTDNTIKLLIDYIVQYVKANGSLSPKVFKWKSVEITPEQVVTISKKHSFKPVTTRKYYSGEHRLELQVNGKVMATIPFSVNT